MEAYKSCLSEILAPRIDNERTQFWQHNLTPETTVKPFWKLDKNILLRRGLVPFGRESPKCRFKLIGGVSSPDVDSTP